MTYNASPKENNFKDLGGEFVLVDESQKNVMQLLDQLGIGTEKVDTFKSVFKKRNLERTVF